MNADIPDHDPERSVAGSTSPLPSPVGDGVHPPAGGIHSAAGDAGDAGGWWTDAVGYEVYIRSFADSNGDGIGDFPGLTSRLDHLADLGIDAVWVTPFYPSPQADFGYDVADYTDVDPVYGTLEDFDAFVARAHDLGLRVIIDIVPNHSSSEHPWFCSAVAEGPDSPVRNHYVWADPAPDGGPPNNWFSIFGGPAWTLDEASGQYYMHLFLPEQPDLNWAEPAVRKAFLDILRFWLDRGVDGFRIDVAHSLTEDQTFPDAPPHPDLVPGAEPERFGDLDTASHLDHPDNVEVFRAWREVADEAGALLLGEVWVSPPELVHRYVDGALHLSFYFGLIEEDWDPETFVAELRHAASVVPDGWAWVQGSHDAHRNVTRHGGGPDGVERSLALWVAMFGLPGTPFLYQGEELALPDGVVSEADLLDPVAAVRPDDGRDPCRTPMPWADGPTNAFTDAPSAWLPAEPRPGDQTVAGQAEDPGSPLSRMRALLAARRRTGSGRTGPVRWWVTPPGTMGYARDGVAHVANLTDTSVAVDVDAGWRLVHATAEGARLVEGVLDLPARSGAILDRSS